MNFVTFEPGWLPDDCSVTEITRSFLRRDK
jgi:hypothetical protein